DRVHSDIDVLAIHPSKVGTEKVIAVTCKAWQSGFRVSRILKAIEEEGTIAGRLNLTRFDGHPTRRVSSRGVHETEEENDQKKVHGRVQAGSRSPRGDAGRAHRRGRSSKPWRDRKSVV